MTSRLTVWPPPPRRAVLKRPAVSLPFPLEETACRLFARARHALWAAVRQLGLRPGDEVLAPAYHHGSEIEALVRAGLVPRFYEARPDLVPDPAELSDLLGRRARALLLVHYLGFPQDAPAWRRWCDERGLLLLEDAAQAWLGSAGGHPLGSSGHLSIFCLYKTVGVPDGAALLCDPPLVAPRAAGGSMTRLARHHLIAEVMRSHHLSRLAGRLVSNGRESGLRDFALGDPTTPPSPVTRVLLPRLAREDVRQRRRGNYRALLSELVELVPAPFDALPGGASPLLLPVVAPGGDKRAFLARLADSGVAGLDFWSVAHPELPVRDFPGAASRRRTVVGLPVHQELSAGDLERVVAAVQRRAGRARRRVRATRSGTA